MICQRHLVLIVIQWLLKICEPELSYILAELFNKCLKESCFPDCWKVSSVFPVFKNVGEGSTAKNYCPVSLLSVVSKDIGVFWVSPNYPILNLRKTVCTKKSGYYSYYSLYYCFLHALRWLFENIIFYWKS